MVILKNELGSAMGDFIPPYAADRMLFIFPLNLTGYMFSMVPAAKEGIKYPLADPYSVFFKVTIHFHP